MSYFQSSDSLTQRYVESKWFHHEYDLAEKLGCSVGHTRPVILRSGYQQVQFMPQFKASWF